MANRKRKSPPNDTEDFRSMVNLVRLCEGPDERLDTNSLTFNGCTSLMEVELCDGLEKIINWAFASCASLECISIPSSVKVIGKGAFEYCKKLTKVELHEGLVRIDDYAFRDCLLLDGIATPSTLEEIGSYSFSRCGELVDLQLTEGLEYIGDYAFHCCDSLLYIRIPTTVKKIGYRAFHQCRCMTHIELPSSVKEICSETFGYCSKLVLVELGEGLERIGYEAFKSCSSLTRIRIPSTVNEIDPRAFEDCEHLVAVEFCEEIEDFLVEHGLNDWRIRGVAHLSLTMFNLLCQYNIDHRLKMLKARKWWNNIHGILESTPDVVGSDGMSGGKLEFHFRQIDRRLAVLETLRDIAYLLELVVWKSSLIHQYESNVIIDNLDGEKKMQHRISCGANVIIPHVLSFLLQFPPFVVCR